jgi:hypothetical protein
MKASLFFPVAESESDADFSDSDAAWDSDDEWLDDPHGSSDDDGTIPLARAYRCSFTTVVWTTASAPKSHRCGVFLVGAYFPTEFWAGITGVPGRRNRGNSPAYPSKVPIEGETLELEAIRSTSGPFDLP